MVIQCTNCFTRYHYDEARFKGAAVKKIRCTKCATVFEIRNPAVGEVPAGFQAEETTNFGAANIGSEDFALDSTMIGGGPRKRPPGAPAPPDPASRAGQPVQAAQPGALRDVRPGTPLGNPFAAVAATAGSHPVSRDVGVPAGGAASDSSLRLPGAYKLSLACLGGPDSGKIFEISRPRMTIGRANADITLADAQCSRQHAAIEVRDDAVAVVDLASTNGTYVGDKRVQRADLENRSEFDVGATTLMLIRTPKD